MAEIGSTGLGVSDLVLAGLGCSQLDLAATGLVSVGVSLAPLNRIWLRYALAWAWLGRT